jgi:hypothetical protein
MSNINTGGPAFPSGLKENAHDEVDSLHKGMTLRDYFAAKALNSLTLTYHFGPNGTSHRPVADEVAAYVYKMADAMLEARVA